MQLNDGFERELEELLERLKEAGTSYESARYYVDALFSKYNREVPAPITGTMNVTEPADHFGE